MTDDDPIRALLADFSRITFGTPNGFRSVLESEVAQAGHDVDAARAWVVEHGGRLKEIPPHRTQTMGEPRYQVIETAPDVRYLIPSEALGIA